MSPWIEFNRENIDKQVPAKVLGVFQLSKGQEKIHYVGRADLDLKETLKTHLDKGYLYFQWVQVPWTKEAYEMHCRLFHHAGGTKITGEDHPYPPEGKLLNCPLSARPASMCDIVA